MSAKSDGFIRGKLTLLRGVPGCGKSTYAQSLKQKHDEIVVFSTDDFFTTYNQKHKQHEYKFDGAKLSQNHTRNQQRVKSKMERQEYAWIIVDNTNIRLQDMVPYAQLALKYNYRIDIRDVKSPHGRNAQQCFEKCVHDVKQNKIQSLLALYEPVSVKQLIAAAGGSTQTKSPSSASIPLEGGLDEGPPSNSAIICPLCNAMFHQTTDFAMHIQLCIGDRAEQEQLAAKARQKHREKTTDAVTVNTTIPEYFKCGYCSYISASKNNCKAHNSTSHAGTPEKIKSFFQCKVCKIEIQLCHRDKHFAKKHSIEPTVTKPKSSTGGGCEQIDIYSEPREVCTQCGLTFNSKAKLLQHTRRNHPGHEFPVEMETLTISDFVDASNTNAIWENEKPVAKPSLCTTCNTVFPSKSALSKHKKATNGQCNMTCASCEKQFDTEQALANHVKAKHSGSDNRNNGNHAPGPPAPVPSRCSDCDELFPSKNALARHTKSMQGSCKKPACPICSKDFSSAQGLKTHIRMKHGSHALDMLTEQIQNSECQCQ